VTPSLTTCGKIGRLEEPVVISHAREGVVRCRAIGGGLKDRHKTCAAPSALHFKCILSPALRPGRVDGVLLDVGTAQLPPRPSRNRTSGFPSIRLFNSHSG